MWFFYEDILTCFHSSDMRCVRADLLICIVWLKMNLFCLMSWRIIERSTSRIPCKIHLFLQDFILHFEMQASFLFCCEHLECCLHCLLLCLCAQALIGHHVLKSCILYRNNLWWSESTEELFVFFNLIMTAFWLFCQCQHNSLWTCWNQVEYILGAWYTVILPWEVLIHFPLT